MKISIKYLKYVPYLVILILFFAGGRYYNAYKKEKANRERLEYNQQQYLSQQDQYQKLTVTFDEFKKSMSAKIDSILAASKIKPKQVTSVTERIYYYRDTSYTNIKPNPVITDKGTIYPFVDVRDCFAISGFMSLQGNRPELTIIDRQYRNHSIDIAYLQREKKFLFFRYGKWRAELYQTNVCGDQTTKEIEVIKKKK